MSEKMTISEALDERDFLVQKITKDIRNLSVVTVKRQKDPRTSDGLEVDTFKQENAALYQSIIDNIDRYKRINVAITLSNATTKITLRNSDEMTVAEAIARKKMISNNNDLDMLLLETLSSQNEKALVTYDRLNKQLENQRSDLLNSMISNTANNNKADDFQVKAVDKILEGSVPEFIDAIGTKDKSLSDIINDMDTKLNDIIKQINSAIKISNATTIVEF